MDGRRDKTSFKVQDVGNGVIYYVAWFDHGFG